MVSISLFLPSFRLSASHPDWANMTIEKKSAERFLKLIGCNILNFVPVLFLSVGFEE